MVIGERFSVAERVVPVLLLLPLLVLSLTTEASEDEENGLG